MKTVVSGIRPTGKLHLGNYFGAVKSFLQMQETHKAFFFIADIHSLTTHPTPDDLHANVHQVLAEYLAMGLDPIWLGIMMAINLQTSFLTPPFGFALFYLRGVAPPEVKTQSIYKGVIPFILIQLFVLLLLAIWPDLATWLPETVYAD